MPDLHGWISQQIDAAEERAQACPPWPWTFDADEDAVLAADGIQVADAFALSSRQQRAIGEFIAANDPAAVLRRCAADRKILARHNFAINAGDRLWAVACHGCGGEGDCWDPVTENLNDCPELLDLAEGYGLAAAELARLDRPQPPERQPSATPTKPLSDLLADLCDKYLAQKTDSEAFGGLTGHQFTGLNVNKISALHPIATELLPPTPIERALDILGPHLQDEPLYREETP